MKSYQKILAVLALSSLALAAPMPSDSEGAVKKSKKHRAEKAAPECAACDAIRELKEKVEAQQAEIDALKNRQPAGTTDAAAQAAAAAAQRQAADAAAAAAAANAAAAGAQSTAANAAAAAAAAGQEAADARKRAEALEEPAYIHFKGVRLTPGGYAQFATIDRIRNANSDTADSYGGYSYGNSPNYYLTEFRATGRASRLSLKAEGEAKGMKFMDYTEIDFLNNGDGSEVQTNSFAPRLRLAFANVDLHNGWSIAGGQNWSMIQTTRQGITPLTEWLPAVIDNAYTPGFQYARLGSIRVVKQVTPKVWLGFSVEEPNTVSAGTFPDAAAITGGLANQLVSPVNGYLVVNGVGYNVPSNNIAPDLVAKVAFQPGFGHFELKYVARWFRDRVNETPGSLSGTNKTNVGGALGLGMVLPVVKNKVDIDFQGLAGLGIGRYTTTGGPDVTFRGDGSLEPVKAVSMVLGIETHPTPKFDFDLYGGEDYYNRTTYVPGTPLLNGATTSAVYFGYGIPTVATTTCGIEGDACGAITKDVWSIQPQAWYRFYKGKSGTVQFGLSYAYVAKTSWGGSGTTAGGFTGVPALTTAKTNNQIFMTSMRYYLP